MCHSGPLSFLFLSPFFSRKITVSHLHFSVLTDLNNFYPQFLFTIFTHNIFTDLHRSSEIFTGLSCLSASFIYSHSLLGTQSPRSSQIFHRSFKDLSKTSFLHPFLPGTWTVGHSGPLSSFPQIFTDLHRSILPFTPYLSIFVYPSLYLQDLHRSSTDLLQIFYRSFKDLSKISLPSSPFTKIWTIGHSGPLFRSPSLSFPPLLI